MGHLCHRRGLNLETFSLVLETMSLSHGGPEFRGGLYVLVFFTCLKIMCLVAFRV
jgi:hypothetical protein